MQARSLGFAQHGHVPVRDLEVVELRAFCAAASLGSIAEAARAMGVSQPAMSKRLRQLETVAGADLFERSSRGVTLTEAGIQLYSVAQRLLRSADSVQALISTPPSAPVRVAASPTIAELRLPQVLSEIAAKEVKLAAELISANSGLVRELVRDGRCDLGIASIDPFALLDDGLEERTVWRDELVLVVPPEHHWVALDEIPADEFAATPVVQRDPWSNSSRIVSSTLERIGLERATPIAAIGSTATVLATSRANCAPALISMLAVRALPALEAVIRRVEGLRFGLEYALVWSGTILDQRREVQAVASHIMQLPFSRPRASEPEPPEDSEQNLIDPDPDTIQVSKVAVAGRASSAEPSHAAAHDVPPPVIQPLF